MTRSILVGVQRLLLGGIVTIGVAVWTPRPGTSAPPPAPPALIATADVGSESPALQLATLPLPAEGGDVRLRILPEVRSVKLRVDALPAIHGVVDPVNVELRSVTPLPKPGAPPLFASRIAADPRQDIDLWRMGEAEISMPTRKEVLQWSLILRQAPLPAALFGGPPASDAPKPKEGPRVRLVLSADTRPISAREKWLMEWRSRIDPAKQPDEVRRLVEGLTEEEVRYYTAFGSRAAFLRHWGRTNPNGLTITDDLRGLVQDGKPLPDGRFLTR